MLKALESGAATGLLFCLLFWVGLSSFLSYPLFFAKEGLNGAERESLK